ncbi:MAG: tyrosine-type recombinase/integrase [Acidimicrobiales bacterium]
MTAVEPGRHLDGSARAVSKRPWPACDLQGSPAWQDFPPRPVPTTWPATTWSRQHLMEALLASPFVVSNPRTQERHRRGLDTVVDWLSAFPGDTWQDRWTVSCAEAEPATGWRVLVVRWLDDTGRSSNGRSADFAGLGAGLLGLIGADVIRPGLPWLLAKRTTANLVAVMARTRDPDAFEALRAAAASEATNTSTKQIALRRVAVIVAAKGGTVTDITVGDCLELLGHLHAWARPDTNSYFYQLLHALGVFPDTAPATARVWNTIGQQDVCQLVDRYRLACREVRDLLVDYLAERRPSLDYKTLNMLAFGLGKVFWADLEAHHPGIDSLRLAPEVATAWKRRIATTTRRPTTASGRVPRADGGLSYLAMVRAFYLDVAQWAADDPARWGRFAAPCPVRSEEMFHKKDRRRRKSRMDQRTRERLPILGVLSATVDRQRREAAERLAACAQTRPGECFTVADQTLRRSVLSRWTASTARIWGEDPDGGVRRDLTLEEHRAFWTWAVVEVLRHTGIRVEELTELSFHSLVSYRLPTTEELVALLQIAPSKSDAERLLVIGPELADVLAVIVTRVRDASGAVPLVISYDIHERVWNSPMPLLFQWRSGMEQRPITSSTIRALVANALAGTGITDASGRPLRFIPHDFRRIFVTDALTSGLPPHIAQVICGHQDINTTISYNTVYPEEVIGAHRAFIARRRATRPSEEYRVPTDAEWEEFLGHFERRRVAYGTCARAFATPCIHEHACLRCPMLWPDPTQRARLAETIENLRARIAEAHREAWLGEVEGLEASLAGAEGKLAQIERQGADHTVALGMPRVAGRRTGEQAR